MRNPHAAMLTHETFLSSLAQDFIEDIGASRGVLQPIIFLSSLAQDFIED